MSKFLNQLRAKGRAEEELYFAKRDRELLLAMKQDKLAKKLNVQHKKKQRTRCDEIENDFDKVSKRYRKKPKKLAKRYRKLVERAKKLRR